MDAQPPGFENNPPADGQPAQRVERMPPWRVLLHDDEVSASQEMIDRLSDLLPLSRAAASQRVLEAHRAGVALLLTTHRERAELYALQLTQANFIVSIERA